MRSHGAAVPFVLLASLLCGSTAAQPPPPSAPPAPAVAPTAAPTAAPTVAPAPAAAPAKPAPKPGPGKAKEPPPPPLPEPQVRLWIVAPSAEGLWTFRLDNEGPRPIRIPADIRLLHFEIDNEGFVVDTAADPKKPGKAQKPKKPKKPVVCSLPAPLRLDSFPDRSALLLAPGQTYVESFDPRLFCFGKDVTPALVGSATVRSWFGWEAPKKPGKKAPEGPFAVQSTEFPATVAPLHAVNAPTIVLSFAKPKPATPPRAPGVGQLAIDPDNPVEPKLAEAPKGKPAPPAPPAPSASPAPSAPPAPPAPKEPAAAAEPKVPAQAIQPIVDENAPRLELSATPFLDVTAPARATITVTATNSGRRPMLAAIRPRMLGFRIDGPSGPIQCDAAGATNTMPREAFNTIKPGGSSSITVLLAEVCPRETFRRPGLYYIKPTLYLGETGADLGLSAYTGVVSAKTPTLLRLLAGPEQFYAAGPKAQPIPKPRPSPEAAGGESDPAPAK